MKSMFDILIDQFIEKNLKGQIGSGIAKIDEEVAEFKENPSVEEAADVLICLLVEMRQRGISFSELITATRQKAYVNLDRAWELRPDGTIHHVDLSEYK